LAVSIQSVVQPVEDEPLVPAGTSGGEALRTFTASDVCH